MSSIVNEIHAKTIVIATQNENKKKEISEILKKIPGILLRGVEDFPFLPEVEEDGNSFRENAIKKATTLVIACNT
ncbi:MAG: non-canonical purine NTP pyrophosphatase, partial [Planctomycetes bacterium]|nr:non-canonical purine NTP pyrophosphatase [Planctomycetota bacterium]